LIEEESLLKLAVVTSFTSCVRRLFDKALSLVLFDPNAGSLAAILQYGHARCFTFVINDGELEALIRREDYKTLAKLELGNAQIEGQHKPPVKQ